MQRNSRQAEEKRRGRNEAKMWLTTATAKDKVEVTGCDFEYGYDTLDMLREEGLSVLSSDSTDFSWGFFKQVKGHVLHRLS